jgi:hypothetical protein
MLPNLDDGSGGFIGIRHSALRINHEATQQAYMYRQ